MENIFSGIFGFDLYIKSCLESQCCCELEKQQMQWAAEQLLNDYDQNFNIYSCRIVTYNYQIISDIYFFSSQTEIYLGSL